MAEVKFQKNLQFYKFSAYGFLKNLRFFELFMILYFREMGLSFFQIGTLLAINELAIYFLEIPTGIVADLFGRRKSMVFSWSSYIVSFLIFYFFPSYKMYLFAMVIYAFGDTFRTGTHKAMIMDYLDRTGQSQYKTYYYGATRSASQLGSAFSAIIGIFLVFYSGSYRKLFLFNIIPYIFGLILMLTYPKYLDYPQGEEKKKRSFKDIFVFTKETGREFFTNKELLKSLLNSSLFDTFFKSMKGYLQPVIKAGVLSVPILLFLEPKDRINVIVGIIYFFIYLSTSYTSRNAAKIAEKIGGDKKVINSTFFLLASLFLFSGLIMYTKLKLLAFLGFFILYILHNLRKPLMVGYLVSRMDKKKRATFLSIESQLSSLSTIVLAPVFGFVVDKMGLATGMVFISLLLYLLAWILKL